MRRTIQRKVSVVIPVYNRANTISDAINSVLSQSYNNYEIILVDDGSTDNLKEIILQYEDKITYLQQENSGPSAARNNGIRNSQGEFIAFLDSDDAWLPMKLEKQIACLEQFPDLGLIGTGYFNCDENLGNPVKQEKVRMASTKREEILIHNLWPTPSIVVRRFCFDIVGMFNENMMFAEDWDMWIRIAQSFSMATLEEPLVYIRRHSKGLAGSIVNQRYNFTVWKQLIHSNRQRSPGMSLVTYLKAMSFYSLNLSYMHKIEGKIYDSRLQLFNALIYWPFFIIKRSKFFRKIHF